MDVPLPWERVLWRHETRWPSRTRSVLTDFRVVGWQRGQWQELALQDIEDVQRIRTPGDKLLGTSTLILRPRRRQLPAVTLRRVRRGAQLAALLELLASDPAATPDTAAVEAVLSWTPRTGTRHASELAAGLLAVVIAISVVVIGLHGESAIMYPEDDAIRPGGEKRSRDEIVDFMETEVLPWAQKTLGPLKGGPERVGCETCHGIDPEPRDWLMPSVSALPEPHVSGYGSETAGAQVDAQMRNAMYGYLAESDNQTKAAYMRQVVVPGMARLLGRPAYDFTRTYEYNRTRFAFGCYHCHQVKGEAEELRN
jgi:hypothetical protein